MACSIRLVRASDARTAPHQTVDVAGHGGVELVGGHGQVDQAQLGRPGGRHHVAHQERLEQRPRAEAVGQQGGNARAVGCRCAPR